MKRKEIICDVELSYEELKCLEAHFRQIQSDAVVCNLKSSSADTKALLDKIISQFRFAKQQELSAKVETQAARGR